MFGVSDPVNHVTTSKQDELTNLDNFKENVIFLYSMDGGNKNVSLNMNLSTYSASVENYLLLNGNQAAYKTGFAFINCLQTDYDEDDDAKKNNKLKDLTISGKVKNPCVKKIY